MDSGAGWAQENLGHVGAFGVSSLCIHVLLCEHCWRFDVHAFFAEESVHALGWVCDVELVLLCNIGI